MQTEPRKLGRSSPLSRVSARSAVVLLGLLVVFALGHALIRTIDLDRRRDETLTSKFDLADVGGAAAPAFRRLRRTLGDGDRFALVIATRVGHDDDVRYRLASLSYLYPAVAADELANADAVVVVGEPSRSVRDEFEELGTVHGVWLGRRRPVE
jgi:hypothetical protein